jgi:hypothetical protein
MRPQNNPLGDPLWLAEAAEDLEREDLTAVEALLDGGAS